MKADFSAPWSEEDKASILLNEEDAPEVDTAVVALPVPAVVVVVDAAFFELPQAARTAPRRRTPTRTVAPRGTRTSDDDVVMGCSPGLHGPVAGPN